MKKSLFFWLVTAGLFASPFYAEAAPTTCHCSSSTWYNTGAGGGSGWITTDFTYATNNGSCTPNGSNTYNFGYADIFVDGEYVGTVNFTTGGTNINDYLVCQNQV